MKKDWLAVIQRAFGDGRLEFMLMGGILGALPLYSLAKGTEHYIPALAMIGIAFTYIGIAVRSAAHEATSSVEKRRP